jgi:ectoine hydroxylase-related dioxygenase (phytanoyl-CoA dioxygenase family)
MAEDLSRYDRPLGAMFHIPETPQQWRQYALSETQLDSYRRDGYVSGVRLLSDEQVDVLREELTPLFDPTHPGHELFHEYHSNESKDSQAVLFHALGAWRVTPAFHDLLWNPAFTVPASQLLGGAVRFWHDQLFCKPARHGGVVAWHQDYSYWTRTVPMAHLTCFIALDDTDVENGCLYHVPGTHRWPLLPVTGLAGDMDAIQTVLSEEQRAMFRPTPTKLKKGYASFHHPLTIHGSYGNASDRPRRATVINVLRDGVTSASDRPLLAGVPAVPPGEPLSGQFFPLLFDPAKEHLT